MGGRTFVLDRHTELELAAGYARELAEKGSHPGIDPQLLPKGVVKHARELVNYSYGHQIIKAYAEVLSSFNRLEEELRVNEGKIASKGKNLCEVSGYVSSAIALVDEMFQNHDKIEPGKKKDVGALRGRFETIKEKTRQASCDYDAVALASDAGKVPEYGQKLSKLVTTGGLCDIMVSLTHSVDDLMFKYFDDGTSKGALYESFVDSIISSLVRKGARQVSE